MSVWPDRRILDLFGIDLPIIQAPMAGASTPEMAIAVSEAGGLGSLPCALYTPAQAREAVETIRKGTSRPINLNFFCHTPAQHDPTRSMAWRARLAPYYVEQGLDPEAPIPASNRAPFDDEFCGLVEDFRPEVVSFHFGLPEAALLERVRRPAPKSYRPRPRSRRRAGWKNAAAMRSSPWAMRPAAIAELSCPMTCAGTWRGRSAPSPWCPRSRTRSRSR